jgi:hypothetical protein
VSALGANVLYVCLVSCLLHNGRRQPIGPSASRSVAIPFLANRPYSPANPPNPPAPLASSLPPGVHRPDAPADASQDKDKDKGVPRGKPSGAAPNPPSEASTPTPGKDALPAGEAIPAKLKTEASEDRGVERIDVDNAEVAPRGEALVEKRGAAGKGESGPALVAAPSSATLGSRPPDPKDVDDLFGSDDSSDEEEEEGLKEGTGERG